MRTRVFCLAFAAVLVMATAATAQMQHRHSDKNRCADASIACATKVTPYFAPDGSLWVAWMAGGHVSVARSTDFGASFSPPQVVNPEPMQLDWGPDARPNIVVDRLGRVHVAFAWFKDQSFNGQVVHAVSEGISRPFAPLHAMTADPESQRFVAQALDTDGSLFVAWLDKRNRARVRDGEKYIGAGLAFSWSSDGGQTFAESKIAHDNTCECCRLGVTITAGKPVVVFRNVFDRTTRDHAVMTFTDPQTPGPVRRVSVDEWKTDACPHHGPSLSVAPDGTYHVTWFTNGDRRQGLFYAFSKDQGATFSLPMRVGRHDLGAAHAYVLAYRDRLWMTWKEFDGDDTVAKVMLSRDGGRAWSAPRVVARAKDNSDHPLLVSDGHRTFLSWMAQVEGYRMLSLEETQ